MKLLFQFPKTEEEWIHIANGFERTWNFPHCIGAIDGKHVQIIPPSGSGSYFYNYKHTHSLVLLGIADSKYKFTMFDFGCNGRISDGGVLRNTIFKRKLDDKTLRIPNECRLNNSAKVLPYVFVGDDAFPLRGDLMKPYRQSSLDNDEKRIFNYRLSRARRIIENVFGILVSRFQIFKSPINLSLENIEIVVKACVALHNYLITIKDLRNENLLEDDDSTAEDEIADGLLPLEPLITENMTEYSKKVRESFVNYFMNEGRVAWQNNVLN